MIYEFVNVANPQEFAERDFRMRDCPPLDSVVEFDGKRWKRIISRTVQVDDGRNRYNYPVVARQLPRNLKGHDTFDKAGHPVILNKAHERETMARHNLVRHED